MKNPPKLIAVFAVALAASSANAATTLLSENFESDWISYVQTLDPHSTYETPEIELPGNLNNILELSRNIRIGFENVIPEARKKHYQLEKKEKTIKLRKLISGIISNSQKLQVTNTQLNEQFQWDLRL